MEKQEVLKALKELKEKSPSRKFTQTIDLIINLQNINVKKEEEKIDLFVNLPYSKGKKTKICALIDAQLEKQAKSLFDKVILKEEFPKYINNKKLLKELAREYDYFIAQANLMTHVAATFGKYLGPKGKMPNPKAGCIVTPETNLTQLAEKLHKFIRLTTKNETIIKTIIGDEKMSDEELSENFLIVYNTLINNLPQKKQNIKSILLKLSMGPVYKFGKGLKLKENRIKKKKNDKKNSRMEKEKS